MKFNEIRLNKKGENDDIVVSDVSSVHIEQMDTGHWWIGIRKENKEVFFEFFSDRKIKCLTTGDQLKLKVIKYK